MSIFASYDILSRSPSPLMLYINSLMHVYLCLNVNFAYTITCIYMRFVTLYVSYQLAINYAHYQPYRFVSIVIY